MELPGAYDVTLNLQEAPPAYVLPIKIPPHVLDEILTDPDIAIRLEFSETGNVSIQSLILTSSSRNNYLI